MSEKFVIFTDLDGTLLDHHNYSFEPALATIAQLKQHDFPIIPNTSKTFFELVPLREALQLDTPFVVENGAAVYIPIGHFDKQPDGTTIEGDYWVKTFAPPVSKWLNLLKQIPQEFNQKFSHFSAMSIEQVIEATGLSSEQATLAAQRQYCEPIYWQSTQEEKVKFIEALKKLGAEPLQGGRFLHLTGNCNKGVPLTWLTEQYKIQFPTLNIKTIALGDGGNDIQMLEAAEYAVRILSPTSAPPVINKTEGVYTSTQFGPSGWAECINKLIKF